MVDDSIGSDTAVIANGDVAENFCSGTNVHIVAYARYPVVADTDDDVNMNSKVVSNMRSIINDDSS